MLPILIFLCSSVIQVQFSSQTVFMPLFCLPPKVAAFHSRLWSCRERTQKSTLGSFTIKGMIHGRFAGADARPQESVWGQW